MDHRILVSRTPGQTRVAVLQDGRLTDFYVDRDHALSIAGAVYCGRVVRTFASGHRAIVDVGPSVGEVFVNRHQGMPWPAEGAKVMVQIVRDPDHGKRPIARLQPVLVGRYLTVEVGVAPIREPQDLENAASIQDLIACLGSGWQARSRLKQQDDLLVRARQEARALQQNCVRIANAVDNAAVGDCLFPGLSGLDLARREIPSDDPVIVADTAGPVRADDRVSAFDEAPSAITVWQSHRGDLLEAEGVNEQLDDALARRSVHDDVTITIDPTEALTAIDVDVAAPAGPGSTKKQSEMLNRILGRVRLLNLGGLIAIDLPGAGGRDRDALISAANEARAADPLPLQFEPPGRFNVMLFSRQQARSSLLAQFFKHDTMLQRALSDESVALEALAAASRFVRVHPAAGYRLTVAPSVTRLLETKLLSAWLALREMLASGIELETDPLLLERGQSFTVEAI